MAVRIGTPVARRACLCVAFGLLAPVLFPGTSSAFTWRTLVVHGSVPQVETPEVGSRALVWLTFDSGVWYHVWVFDLENLSRTQVNGADQRATTNSFLPDSAVDTAASLVTWYGANPSQVFLYDLDTGVTEAISEGPSLFPVTDGRYVAMQGVPAGQSDVEIYVYDNETQTGSWITDNDIDDTNPEIDAGRVVWNAEGDVYLHEIGGGDPVPIDSAGDNRRPRIRGDHIVWARTGDGDVVHHEISSGITTVLTADDPTLWGDSRVGDTTALLVGSGQLELIDLASGDSLHADSQYDADLFGKDLIYAKRNGTAWELHHFDTETGVATRISTTTNGFLTPSKVHAGEGELAWWTPNHSAWWGSPDSDDDGLRNVHDNCVYAPNGGQEDADGNGIGNACECGDTDDDGLVASGDEDASRADLTGASPLAPAGALKCGVYPPGTPCDLLQLVVLRRALLLFPPGIAQLCEAALPP